MIGLRGGSFAGKENPGYAQANGGDRERRGFELGHFHDFLASVLSGKVRVVENRISDEGLAPASHDVRASGQERHAFGNSAPDQSAVPFRRPFVGKELGPHRGMDAVGADQHVTCLLHGGMTPPLTREVAGHLIASPLLESDEVVPQMNAPCDQALLHDLQQGRLEFAAMDGYLRPAIACLEARGSPQMRWPSRLKYASSRV